MRVEYFQVNWFTFIGGFMVLQKLGGVDVVADAKCLLLSVFVELFFYERFDVPF